MRLIVLTLLFSIEQVAEALGLTVEEAQASARAYLKPEDMPSYDGVPRVQ